VHDVEIALRFYRDELGFMVTEEIAYQGQRCVFLRVNTEHHSLALYPRALRAQLDLPEKSSLMSFGLQVANYRQLRDAIAFLQQGGVRIRHLPPELFPGIDYSAFAVDPDGHALQLYYYMEQIGWDGKPRPAHLRPKVDNTRWPESVPAASDTFNGEVYLGPWS
jgi:catechol 2,3-dioxygenase-like lactoylglutathione lyase family enzyme